MTSAALSRTGLATAAFVCGDVRLGASASVWACAVVRGDTDTITIGDGSNVQDGAVLSVMLWVPSFIALLFARRVIGGGSFARGFGA